MKDYHILIVEDDWDINALLHRILTEQGYTVTSAYSGSEAAMLAEREVYDLILLDLMLPGVSGEELIARVRPSHTEPILVLSAKPGVEARTHALRLGADDFLTKPFDTDELLARVEAQLRRAHVFARTEGTRLLRYKQCTVDRDLMTVTVRDEPLSLTALEYQLLLTFLENPNRIFTRDALFAACWGQDYLGTDNTVDVHISHIRNKLAAHDTAEYIATVRGIGYRLAK